MLSFLQAIAPVQLAVDFSPIDPFSAVLGLTLIQDNHNPVHSHLTVIHCSLSGDEVSSDSGEATEIHEGEALICLVRRIGAVVASGVFEANCSLYATTGGALLIPRALSNLVVTQTRHDEPASADTAPLATEQGGTTHE